MQLPRYTEAGLSVVFKLGRVSVWRILESFYGLRLGSGKWAFLPLVRFLVNTMPTAALPQCLSTSKKGLLNLIISHCEVN